ncbi:DUF4249 domain-containing protein [Olivibacter sp. SDN3]|uniref:DUF4249 domain-containing protein n=1 Tax=Olivibacter sp. SDN3 TaxID=2764720 RepID=UPI0016515B92|nr:DUF4249 domain-containing protein [Olivibacter sp. SDN3]QNL49673.1 DUF4249 domain-containing protein [Olivibacter sp. SDN3]
MKHTKVNNARIMSCLLLLVCMVVLLSCEKVVDINLNDADPALVIEGNISDLSTTHYVSISKTVPFSANSTDNPVTGAVVQVLEEATNDSSTGFNAPAKGVRSFTEVSPGLYSIRNYRAYPGMKYTLTVVVEEETYLAEAIMPRPIAIDSIGTVTDNIFGEEEKMVGVVYQDPPNEQNYYRYILTINGAVSSSIFVYNDKFNDGKKVQRNLYDEDLEVFTRDSVMVEQQSITQAVYTYFNGIRSNNPGSAAPANPQSNFSNGALGYFSAHGVRQASTIIE